ncbi:hypothetical protein L195_g039469, partial [Trifolium pratense]
MEEVLAARYRVERCRLREGGRSESSWWREIGKIRDDTRGVIPLCVRYERLFNLAVNTSGM